MPPATFESVSPCTLRSKQATLPLQPDGKLTHALTGLNPSYSELSLLCPEYEEGPIKYLELASEGRCEIDVCHLLLLAEIVIAHADDKASYVFAQDECNLCQS